jgi:hypothetical protein
MLSTLMGWGWIVVEHEQVYHLIVNITLEVAK